MRVSVGTLVAVMVLLVQPAECAPAATARSWHDVKCERYKKAWAQALDHFGPQGLGRPFLDRHAAFLASNCTLRADVCARSAEELRLANAMVVLSMNAGTASTFPPFYCRP